MRFHRGRHCRYRSSPWAASLDFARPAAKKMRPPRIESAYPSKNNYEPVSNQWAERCELIGHMPLTNTRRILRHCELPFVG